MPEALQELPVRGVPLVGSHVPGLEAALCPPPWSPRTSPTAPRRRCGPPPRGDRCPGPPTRGTWSPDRSRGRRAREGAPRRAPLPPWRPRSLHP
eukprot:14843258-Alexandrium_andersonii.AAC.1